MAALFKRRVRVTISAPIEPGSKGKPPDRLVPNGKGGFTRVPGKELRDVIEIEDLRVQFKVKKSDCKHPNTAEIVIVNLNRQHRAQLEQKGVQVILQAGYEQLGMSQIFVGDARTVDHVRAGPDWNTTIKSGDGERAFVFGRVSASFAAGVAASNVIYKVAQALARLGVSKGNLDEVAPNLNHKYLNGYTAHGTAASELDKLLAPAEYHWSIQDGQLVILRDNDHHSRVVPDITPDSGLVGSPHMAAPEKKKGKPLLKVRCLLNGDIMPGGLVKLRSERYDGVVRVVRLEHHGDTHEKDWYTTFEGYIK